nr:fimbria/pilus outer membrane usher protein [Stenotrophomonas rhizophila]
MPRFQIHALAAAVTLVIAVVSAPVMAAAGGGVAAGERVYEFRSGQFPGSTRVDLSRFNKGNVILPGTYAAAVQVNGRPGAPESLRFAVPAGQQDAQLCVDRLMLDRFGIDLQRVDEDRVGAGVGVEPGPAAAVDDCLAIEQWVPGASVRFEQGEQELFVQVPQLYMSQRPRDYVSPEQLDGGVTAATLQYNANVYDSHIGGIASTRGYLGIRAGINAGGWLLRHQGSLTWSNSAGSRYQASATFAQRDVVSLQSQLMVGQLYSQGDLFGSVRMRGVELVTDDRMLPQSLVGYAPVVRGIADSNALVRVLQRGVPLRELTVAPGPFEIDDLYAVGYGGDLEVVVREADGREKTFVVPYSGSARLLRPGYTRYAVSAGQADAVRLGYQPYLLQAQMQRGLSNAVTGYTGALKSEHYAAAQLGASLNTPLGAFSLDMTQARLQLPSENLSGQSVQLRFSKQLVSSGTNFSVGAYRYSTEGYVDLNQALRLRAEAEALGDPQSLDRYRSRLEGSVSQAFGRDGGALYFNASSTDYWNRSGRTLNYSLSYSNRWKTLSYSLSAQRSRQLSSQHVDNEIGLTLNMPLGTAERAPSLYSTVRSDRNHDIGGNIGISGSAGRYRDLQYGVNLAHAQDGATVGGNVQYQAPYAQLGASYSQGQDNRNSSFDLSGGLAVHGGGVTLAPRLGDTIGLVRAPDAAGARVDGGDGARVDSRGYALVPSLLPYRFNRVELDPRGMSTDVQLKTTTRMVAPRHGAVVRLDYPTDTGRSVLIKARRSDGSPLPFAASVFDVYGNSVGSVGQGSRVQLRSDDANGVVTVRWGKQGHEQCEIFYQLPDRGPARQGLPDVIEQAVCERIRHVASEVQGNRISAAPPSTSNKAGGTDDPIGIERPGYPPTARSLPRLPIPGTSR